MQTRLLRLTMTLVAKMNEEDAEMYLAREPEAVEALVTSEGSDFKVEAILEPKEGETVVDWTRPPELSSKDEEGILTADDQNSENTEDPQRIKD